jgi:hypothetical protein
MLRPTKIDFDLPEDLDLRLSFGASPQDAPRAARVIAHHLVITGYGHWLPNDIRGSGSAEIKQEKLEQLGPIHYGRKRSQPSREQIRKFFREAEPLLEFDRIGYINQNPIKEGLPPQSWPFVQPYNGWPLHRVTP